MPGEAPYEKAAEEGAKALAKITDAGTQAGSYLTRTFSPTIQEIADWTHEIVKSKKAAWRAKNTRVVLEGVYANRPDLIDDAKPIPARLQTRILKCIADEDSDALQKLWINLLRNAIDKNYNYDLRTLHMRILEEIDPAEATILNYIENLGDVEGRMDGQILCEALGIEMIDLDPYLYHLSSLGCFRAESNKSVLIVDQGPKDFFYIEAAEGSYYTTALLNSFFYAVSDRKAE